MRLRFINSALKVKAIPESKEVILANLGHIDKETRRDIID